jgi:transcriptional regulator with XRE-family HTH domain
MKTLADIRDEKKITQEEMAKELGISVSTYNMYENGKRKIPSDIVEAICKKLRLSKEKYFLPSTFTVRKTKVS